MVELIQKVEPRLVKTLVELETENFGASGLNEWMLVPLIRHGRVFIISHETKIAGLCQYMLDWEKRCKAYLIGISLRSDVRNQGLGTVLLEESIRHLTRDGIREIELTVSPDNVRAVKVYREKLGFEAVGFSENEYGPAQHRLVMNRLL